MDTHLKQPKYGIPIRLVLTNGDDMAGLVYVHWGQRVRDLLCEKEAFLPVRTTTGTHLLNKASIIRADILTLDQITERQAIFPEVDLDYLSYSQW
ncbi:hypothetical protein [Rubellimicrobium roseum]|uniref:Uncharacterized protein n=1 Tax=Rubellimicrobium roseum TaxID=687525 RepID=A0A5C4NEC9_9RHOB|nr:hypothetical protein [Rubellimicrobium roseum]TNC72245.1 hypothetical protein FHG71_09375 [Rubellimicrobium roseum]